MKKKKEMMKHPDKVEELGKGGTTRMPVVFLTFVRACTVPAEKEGLNNWRYLHHEEGEEEGERVNGITARGTHRHTHTHTHVDTMDNFGGSNGRGGKVGGQSGAFATQEQGSPSYSLSEAKLCQSELNRIPAGLSLSFSCLRGILQWEVFPSPDAVRQQF